jgi:glycosyltransferase involved in cell wall biosynthesis
MFIAIVPALNESKHIGSVIRNLFQHVDKVVVVDDCSQDDTTKIAEEAGAIVLRHELNCGQGAALQTGHDYVSKIGADYIVHFDGDGQFDVQDIKPALAKMKESGAEILFGSRFLDSRSQVPWLKKYFILPLGKLVNWLFTGIKLSDAHNGFRILNKRALEKIVITQDGMAHASEILALVKKHHLKYIEFPVKVTYSEFGQGVSGGLKTLRDLVFGKFVK